tara:strand:+ start:22546 stop:24231 length:1686 start_codon:yes stop_codon:yes gene_type:complete
MAKPVLDMIFDPRIRLLMITAAIQTAKSLILELALGHVAANNPGPTMFLNQDDDEAGDEATTRIYPLLESMPAVASLLPPKHRRRKDYCQLANGMQMWIKGANLSNLQRRSVRWMFGDEWWLWQPGFIEEARSRLTKFGWLSKGVFASQGGHEEDEGHQLIEKLRQLDWGWTCPDCGTWQPWDFNYIGGKKEGRPGLSWDHCKTADGLAYDEDLVRRCTIMICRNQHCGRPFDDRDAERRRLGRTSRFDEIKAGSEQEAAVHWNALPFESAGELGVQYLRAKKAIRSGDPMPMKKFRQKKLAEKWTEVPEDFAIEIQTTGFRMGDNWDDEAGLLGRTIFPPPFPNELKESLKPLRVLIADVQRDHFWVGILSFAVGNRSRVRLVQGGLGTDGIHSWEDIEELAKEHNIVPSLVGIDAGYDTNTVYTECAKRGWTALMGEDRDTFRHRVKVDGEYQVYHRFYSPVKRIPMGHGKVCRMHFFSNLNCKDMVARCLASGQWQLPDNAPKALKESLESEQRKLIKKKPRWVQIGKRANHYWDILSMGAAFSYMLKLAEPPNTVNP